MSRIVIVGAGQAASSCAMKLRDLGHEGNIKIIGEETEPPYQRPPLSKAYLLGDLPKERLTLRPEQVYQEKEIALHLGAHVTEIDTAAKRVVTDAGAHEYDTLVLTTGARPRPLPDSLTGGLGGIYTVRSLSDVDGMQSEFREGAHVLIIGGGYIGLEAAAVSRKLGLEVTLVEATDRILQRVACKETSDAIRALHQGHGVRILEGIGVDALGGEGRVSSATLINGETLTVDFIIAGIGALPNQDLADAAGLDCGNGITVDDHGRTSDPNIWAAGDCTLLPFRGTQLRLESVQNAIDQAEAVAANIVGQTAVYDPKPWFWSDQYDAKLQIAGLNLGYDKVIVRSGDKDGDVSYWYYKGDALLAVDAINEPRAYMVGKRLIDAGRSADPAQVGDTSVALKALLAG